MTAQTIEKEVPLYILNPQASSDQLEEGLQEFLTQLITLTELGLHDGLPDYPPLFIHNYLWIIHHYAMQVKEIIEAIFFNQQKNIAVSG